MLRGDYAGALAAYRGVADIADLEPGLLPASMRREAAASAVTGGAVSVQVARLVRECEQRARQRVVEPLCRVRAAPPGMCGAGGSAVAARVVGAAASMSDPLSPLPPHSGRGTSRTSSGRVSTAYPAVCERHVVDLAEDSVAVRCVVPSVPLWIQDNFGQQWHLASRDTDHAAVHMNNRRTRALGSAGAMAAAYYAAYRDVHPVVAKAIRDAPAGRMSDALRSATPVCGPTAGQAATMRALFEARQCLQHPNLVPVLGYSESLEGGVVVIWQFCPGGSLRQLQCRYPTLQPISVARFAFQISSALAYLHDRGVVHGNLHLDDVMVNADGSCRLAGYEADYAATRRLFKTHRTCYLSPAMAAGALPTTSCDMFCYGLLTLELLTRQPCWRWVLGEAGQPLGSADALRELMRGGGRAFSDALAQGRVVVNVEALAPLPASAATAAHGAALLRDLLSPDPAQRPSAAAVRELSKAALATFGLVVEEDTWRQNAQGVSEG
ncbi:Protein tyrosine kinase/Protein kinase domain containing protein [Novymonas esmeraldas]|uniref:Protein tyrosine kinase/Protein kinase domain containing protein n=1 Tax=Novymonas esmeraldas TaxID=1808958 RepID=A0AAW0EY92_9TRYP